MWYDHLSLVKSASLRIEKTIFSFCRACALVTRGSPEYYPALRVYATPLALEEK